MTVAKRRKPPAKKSPPKRWIINGKLYREEDLPAGVKHPQPAKADYYAPVDEAVLKRIRTPHMVNRRTKKADLANGIPIDAVLSFTDRGIVLRDMYGLETKLPWKSRKKDEWGDRLKVHRGAIIGCEQKIYYRDIVNSPDPENPMGSTLRIIHGDLAEPMWRDWRPRRGLPVGREDEHRELLRFNPLHARTWTEKAI